MSRQVSPHLARLRAPVVTPRGVGLLVFVGTPDRKPGRVKVLVGLADGSHPRHLWFDADEVRVAEGWVHPEAEAARSARLGSATPAPGGG